MSWLRESQGINCHDFDLVWPECIPVSTPEGLKDSSTLPSKLNAGSTCIGLDQTIFVKNSLKIASFPSEVNVMEILFALFLSPLRWRRNGHGGVSNHQPHHCLLNRLFGCRSKKTSKLRVTGLCAGNSPGTGEFPAQMASNTENVSIWWRHYVSNNLDKILHMAWQMINIPIMPSAIFVGYNVRKVIATDRILWDFFKVKTH